MQTRPAESPAAAAAPPAPPAGFTPSGRKGERPFDRWSLVHIVSGLGLGLLAMPWWLAIVLLLVYEVFEAGLRHVKMKEGGLFEYESWPNIGADLFVGMLGYFAGRAFLLVL